MNISSDHVLLTRFNLPSAGAESFIRAKEHWLRKRMELFETYCLPSVRGQDVDDVRWIIYLDPESPAWLRESMTTLSADGSFTPIYRESVSDQELRSDLRSVVGPPRRMLVTSNLDNDDGLANDFSRRVRALVTDTTRRVIYVDQGLILAGDAVYLRRDTHNAFCSVAETWDEPVSCWSTWHNELDQHMPAAHAGGGPGWLQVIHGDNVSNRVRGTLTSPSGHRTAFAPLLDAVPEPTQTRVLRDRFVRLPLRSVREAARAATKKAVYSIGGKQALEKVRARWSALRHRVR